MTNETSKDLTDKLFESIREDIDDFYTTHEQIDSSVDYEERVLKLAHEFAAKLITTGVGKMPKDRNAKKKS